MRYLALLLLLAVFVTPLEAKKPKREVERTGTIYNLTSGERIVFTYANKMMTATLASGERLTGDYATIAEGSDSWGEIYNRGTTQSGAQWNSSNTSSRSSQREASARGTAIATGDKGTIIQCEYVTTQTSGTGFCEDNHGVRYKLMF
jgi:hypothetical protein